LKKNPMVKSVIYLLFSYQTGYIMWHSRLRVSSIFKRLFFLLEAFWLDVTTSKDECTWTRLTSVVFTRKRPFTEETSVVLIVYDYVLCEVRAYIYNKLKSINAINVFFIVSQHESGNRILFLTFETDQFLFLAMWDFLFSPLG
jgi:hypothetical protein